MYYEIDIIYFTQWLSLIITNTLRADIYLYRSLVYPFIYTETKNGKAPTSVLLFYCFETVKGLDT